MLNDAVVDEVVLANDEAEKTFLVCCKWVTLNEKTWFGKRSD